MRDLLVSHATRVALSIVFLVGLLTAGLVVEYFLLQHALSSASAAHQIAMVAQQQQNALCEAGNTARAQQVNLWQYIIQLSPAKTEQQRENIVKFETYLNHVFAPRNCAHL